MTARLTAQDAPLPLITLRILLSPAAVLRQRPDIQAAERPLAAATALKAAAITDLYPRVSFAMFFGLRNTALGVLCSAAFNRSRRRATGIATIQIKCRCAISASV